MSGRAGGGCLRQVEPIDVQPVSFNPSTMPASYSLMTPRPYLLVYSIELLAASPGNATHRPAPQTDRPHRSTSISSSAIRYRLHTVTRGRVRRRTLQ